MLSSQHSDSTDSTIDSGVLLKKIDAFLEIVKNISDELSTSNSLSTATTSQSRNLLQQVSVINFEGVGLLQNQNYSLFMVMQVHKKVEDLQGLLSKKRSSIVHHLSKTKFRRNSGSSNTSITSAAATLGVHPAVELKSARSTSQLDETGKTDLRRESSSLKSASSSLSLDEDFHGSVISGNGKHLEDNTETKRIKRGHVLKELLQTEQTYVIEIGDILTVHF